MKKFEDLKIGDIGELVDVNVACSKSINWNYTGIISNIDFNQKIIDFVDCQGRNNRVRGKHCLYSRKISPECRKLLKEYIKSEKVEKNLENQLTGIQQNLSAMRKSLKDTFTNDTGILSCNDFNQKFASYFEERFYKFNPQKYNVDISCWCTKKNEEYIEICVSKEIAKYATPDEFSFLYREYDDNLFIIDKCEDNSQYNSMCNNCCPNVLNIPSKLLVNKPKKFLELGDKNTIHADTTYCFKLPYGYSIKTLEFIKNSLESEIII